MANQKIRQEINIVCASVSGTGTVTANAIVALDTTQYSGSPAYYFEAVFNGAASNTGTIKLRDLTGSSNIASLAGATSATYTIARVAFTPTAGAREYTLQIVGDGTRTQTVHSARIIVLQDEAVITQTETQIEVGNQVTGLTNTAAADITNPKFWKYNSANFDGTKTFFAEAVWTTSAKNTVTITLSRVSDNGTAATIVNLGTNSTGYTRSRVAFNPTDGETYRIRALSSTTKSSYSIACAKVIVDSQAGGDGVSGGRASSIQAIQGGSGVGASEQKGEQFVAYASYSFTKVRFLMFKVGSPSDNLNVDFTDTSISNAAISTSNSVAGSSLSSDQNLPTQIEFTFSSPVSLTSGTTYYFRVYRSGARDTSNYYSLVAVTGSGNGWNRATGVWNSTAGADFVFEVVRTDVPIANVEPQFLLLNTSDSNATGVQNYLGTWNSGEWDAGSGTITYKHAMDSDNASNSIKLRDVTASADISNSTVTGSGQQVSAALGSFTDTDNLDCWVLNTTGVIAASRIIVIYAYSAVAAVTLPEFVQAPLQPSLRWHT